MYLEKYGKNLIEKGYEILPIKENSKRPQDRGWTTNEYNESWIDKAITNGHANCGIGIKTKFTPAVDIDTDIGEIQDKIFDYCREKFGADFIRWGRRPLLVFKTETPFKKITSKKFYDAKGEKHQVEILAEGQQFVLKGVHPESHKAYETNGDIPTRDSLPQITEKIAIDIINFAEKCFIDHGLHTKNVIDQPTANVVNLPQENKPPLNLAPWQINKYIDNCGLNPDDYDDWIKLGMCLYHQYRGDYEGLLTWRGWSQRSEKYKDEEIEIKWDSFSNVDNGLTFRTIVKLSNDNEKQDSVSARDKCIEEINNANGGYVILDDILPRYKGLFQDADLEAIAQLAKRKFKELEGYPQSIANIRLLLKDNSNNDDQTQDLTWCKDYIYLQDDHMFFNTKTTTLVKPVVFNHLFYNRVEAQDGMPSMFVVSNDHVDKYNNIMYDPQEQGTFFIKGREYYNSYVEHYVKPTVYNDNAVALFLKHCENLIPDKREREIFISFLSYIVQNKGRVNWGVMLEGPEGNGKSFFEVIMRLMIGDINIITNELLKSPFNSWCQGTTFNILSELKIAGENRYTSYNNLKTYITDDYITYHDKGLKPRVIKNTASYMVMTNYKNAAPIDKHDRRLFVIFTNPTIQSGEYFNELFRECKKHVFSIKQFLINYQYHRDFKPEGRAPETSSHDEMVKINRSNVEIIIDEAIEDGSNIYITDDFVSVGAIKIEMEFQGYGKINTNIITNKLHAIGYKSVGRFMHNTEKHSFWTKKERINIADIRQKLDKN